MLLLQMVQTMGVLTQGLEIQTLLSEVLSSWHSEPRWRQPGKVTLPQAFLDLGQSPVSEAKLSSDTS